MISQAGLYKLTLYENKSFSFLYNADGTIDFDSISNSGDVLEFETNDNRNKYSNEIKTARNNDVVNSHKLELWINGLIQSNLDTLEKLTSSIYGWIPLIEFMNNDKYLIDVPFFEKVNPFDSQVTHTFFIELKPRLFSIKKLQSVIESTGVIGLLDFDGVDDYVSYSSYPNVDGNKTIKFKVYIRDLSAGFSFKEDEFSSDQLIFYVESGFFYIRATKFTRYRIDNITPVNGTQYNFEINKGSETLNSITINDQAATFTGVASTNGNESTTIGQYVDNSLSTIHSTSLFWAFEIEGIFTADGQPDGNLAPAWSQSLSATVNGNPTTTNLP